MINTLISLKLKWFPAVFEVPSLPIPRMSSIVQPKQENKLFPFTGEKKEEKGKYEQASSFEGSLRVKEKTAAVSWTA